MIISLEGEVWKDIKGLEGKYMISNIGRVYSFPKNKGINRTVKVLKILNQRYSFVNLYYNHKLKRCSVHRLVAIAFIEKVNGKESVNHIDGNRYNNTYTNLEWVTPKENTNHAINNNLINSRGVNNGFSKFTEKDIRDIFKLKKSGISAIAIAKTYNVDKSCIHRILCRKTYNDIIL